MRWVRNEFVIKKNDDAIEKDEDKNENEIMRKRENENKNRCIAKLFSISNKDEIDIDNDVTLKDEILSKSWLVRNEDKSDENVILNCLYDENRCSIRNLILMSVRDVKYTWNAWFYVNVLFEF